MENAFINRVITQHASVWDFNKLNTHGTQDHIQFLLRTLTKTICMKLHTAHHGDSGRGRWESISSLGSGFK